ncbi:MAG: hypothetical protein L3K17_07000 [Thermoplasmata archaeon]|nr:hypothetical protein [Thermoplasmata archaeon]
MPGTPRAPAAPRGEEETAGAERDRRSRAREEPLEVSWTQTDPFGIAIVRNPLHGTRYRAYLPALPDLESAMCTCQDFARRGLSTCKHLEAIRLWLVERPVPAIPPTGGADVSRVWATVDRGRRARRTGPVTARSMRSEGRVLIDRPNGSERAAARP